ncbi:MULTISPECIES: hypothetical protein [unclassified Polaromonas]|uniref:hypothetical protein n=1 Tax=unclassified Polaromonas TaxID=2638319 RepID=UPI0018C9F177|nr:MULTISPECIES: hypothetical protein [unclassified Polaromonas]MBG6072858.1 hypothetical protein [Polaromonas sp. CG_9.7]MBG6114863.1 hypothetical protein [Polaromonas sp. CG_9.2]MDH6184709.1 hypothetical protein [Polaromonas sp. CG_23.6]
MDLIHEVLDRLGPLLNSKLFECNKPFCDALKSMRLEGSIRAVQSGQPAWRCRGPSACVAGQCESMGMTQKQGGQVMRTNTLGTLPSLTNFYAIAGLAMA